MTTQETSTGTFNPAQDAAGLFNKPIALVGLMGSGKSVIGRRLAKHLGLQFADSDQLVTQMAGVSIADIFDLDGEAKFRDMEFRAIQSQLKQLPHVLATGGGAFCEPSTAAMLRENAIVIWLQASPDTLLERIGDTNSRPLLQTGPPRRILQQLQAARTPYYRKAHIHLNTDGLTLPKSLAALVSALDSFRATQ
jgi:shikimate kinase